MAGQYARFLDARALAPNAVCPDNNVVDFGAFRVVIVDCRLVVLGTGGNLIIETASVKEEGAWRTVVQIPLNAAPLLLEVQTFARYLRWRTDGAVAGGPVATVDLVAKE